MYRDRRSPALFRGRHFEDVIILLCVRWYLLTYRDLEEIMAEQNNSVDHDLALDSAVCADFESADSARDAAPRIGRGGSMKHPSRVAAAWRTCIAPLTLSARGSSAGSSPVSRSMFSVKSDFQTTVLNAVIVVMCARKPLKRNDDDQPEWMAERPRSLSATA